VPRNNARIERCGCMHGRDKCVVVVYKGKSYHMYQGRHNLRLLGVIKEEGMK